MIFITVKIRPKNRGWCKAWKDSSRICRRKKENGIKSGHLCHVIFIALFFNTYYHPFLCFFNTYYQPFLCFFNTYYQPFLCFFKNHVISRFFASSRTTLSAISLLLQHLPAVGRHSGRPNHLPFRHLSMA